MNRFDIQLRPRQGRSRFACKASTPLSAVAGLALVAMVTAAHAGDDDATGVDYYSRLSCAELWYERNAIFARFGHCFKSQRALATFGNVCAPPYGKLPSNMQRVVGLIESWERRRGCT